jgi:hypothetical protein
MDDNRPAYSRDYGVGDSKEYDALCRQISPNVSHDALLIKSTLAQVVSLIWADEKDSRNQLLRSILSDDKFVNAVKGLK